MCEEIEIYSEVFISCNETNYQMPVRLYEELKKKGVTCSIGVKDFLPGKAKLNNARSAVSNARVIVAYVTETFNDCDMSWYESALGLDLDKHVVLIKTEKAKIHDLLRSCKIINVKKQSYAVWLKEFLKLIKRLLSDKGKTIQGSVQHSLLRMFLWTVEDKFHNQKEYAYTEGAAKFLSEINMLKIQKQVLMKLRFDEISELRQNNDEQQREIQCYQKQLKAYDDDRRILLTQMEVNRYHQLQFERLAQRYIDDHLNLKKIQNLLDEMNIQNKTSENLIQEISGKIEKLTKNSQNDRNSLDMLITMIYSLKVKGHDNDKSNDECRIPDDILIFCKEYEKMIGPNVLQLCRHLELTDEQVDEVQLKSEYGFCEMFWVTIRKWISNSVRDECDISVRYLINVLEEMGIPMKGKPMPMHHLKALQKNMSFLQTNVLSIVPILSELLEKEVINSTGISYVLAVKTSDVRILRLVDILSTTEKGYSAFNLALQNSGQRFIADRIMGSVADQVEEGGKIPTENEDLSNEEAHDHTEPKDQVDDRQKTICNFSDDIGPCEKQKPQASVRPILQKTISPAHIDIEYSMESLEMKKSRKRRKFSPLGCFGIQRK